jgi:hypothetical protein
VELAASYLHPVLSHPEFRVITNNFNAEFGRNTGAIVDVVTKSGTNQLHLDAYWFGRYNGFGGARDWFNRGDQPQNPYVRNQFGYSIGGPIIKNKTFFFFNNEFQRFRTSLTGTATVPTQDFRNGVFTWNTTDPNGNPWLYQSTCALILHRTRLLRHSSVYPDRIRDSIRP